MILFDCVRFLKLNLLLYVRFLKKKIAIIIFGPALLKKSKYKKALYCSFSVLVEPMLCLFEWNHLLFRPKKFHKNFAFFEQNFRYSP